MPVSILASEIESRGGTSEGKTTRRRRHRPNAAEISVLQLTTYWC
jgi:hypothetical protein